MGVDRSLYIEMEETTWVQLMEMAKKRPENKYSLSLSMQLCAEELFADAVEKQFISNNTREGMIAHLLLVQVQVEHEQVKLEFIRSILENALSQATKRWSFIKGYQFRIESDSNGVHEGVVEDKSVSNGVRGHVVEESNIHLEGGSATLDYPYEELSHIIRREYNET